MLNLFASNGTVWKNAQKGYLDGGMTLIFQEIPRINLRQLFLLWLIFSRNSSSMVRRALAKNPIHYIFNFLWKNESRGCIRCTERFIWMQIIISQPWAVNLDKSCDFKVIPYVMYPQYHKVDFRPKNILCSG